MVKIGEYFQMEQLPQNDPSMSLCDLGSAGLEYAREQLRRGGRLSRLVSERVMYSAAAFLPFTTTGEKRANFLEGGSGSNRYVWIGEIADHINRARNGIVLADGWGAEPSLPFVQAKQHVLTEDEDVYFFSSRQYPTDDDFVFRWTSRYPSLAVSSLTAGTILPNQHLTENELGFIARKATAAYVGIFDEETFMRVLLR